MSKKKFTYKDAGVDIEAGEEMVESIKSLVKETHSDAVQHWWLWRIFSSPFKQL